MKLFQYIILISLFLCLAKADTLKPILANGNTANSYAIQITYDTDELRLKIITTFEPLESNQTGHYIVIETDEETHQKLLNLDLNITINTYFTEQLNNRTAIQTDPFSLQDNNLSIPYSADQTIRGYSCYRTVEGTFATARNIVSRYPHLAQWIDVGDSWEKKHEQTGYDMYVLKLTNLNHNQKKPALFITSSIHAREYAPAELATQFAEYLVSNYGINADVTWMLDHHEVHLMLMANPDGRKYAENGQSWRKNANINHCNYRSHGRYPYVGVDLNRNFTFKWNCCEGSSNYDCSLVYHGIAPSSEPETQAIQNYMIALFGDHRDASLYASASLDTSGIYIDLHSAGGLILWPWGFTKSPPANNMVTLGRKFAYSNHYTPKQAIGLYPTEGTTHDFGYGELGIPSYIFELGTKFFQDCSTFTHTIVPDNMPSLIYALKAVRRPYQLPLGPEVTNLTLSSGEATVTRGTTVTLRGIANDKRYNNTQGYEPTQHIIQAEYYIDIAPWEPHAHAIPIQAEDGTYNNAIESLRTSINTELLNEGRHTIFVRAKDADNHWGVISAVFLNISTNIIPTIPFNTIINNAWAPSTISTHRRGSYAQYYTFTLTKSTTVTIDLTSNKDTYLFLLSGIGKDGSIIEEDDDGGEGFDSKIKKTLPAGDYTIETSTYRNNTLGSFAIKVTTPQTESIPTIPFNTIINNAWAPSTISTHRRGSYAQYYTFTLTKSTTVTIDLTSNKDTYLFLLSGIGKDGSIIEEDDDGGEEFNSKIKKTLPAGDYTIEASTYRNSTQGSFTLKIQR